MLQLGSSPASLTPALVLAEARFDDEEPDGDGVKGMVQGELWVKCQWTRICPLTSL